MTDKDEETIPENIESELSGSTFKKAKHNEKISIHKRGGPIPGGKRKNGVYPGFRQRATGNQSNGKVAFPALSGGAVAGKRDHQLSKAN